MLKAVSKLIQAYVVYLPQKMDLSHLIKRKRKLKDFSHSEKQSLLIWLRPLVWVHVGLITTA